MTKLNLRSADRDVYIQGDDAAARTIRIGQTTGTFDDLVEINSANFAVATAGTGVVAGLWVFNGGVSSPSATASSTERFGLNAGAALTSGFGNQIVGRGAGANLTGGNNNVIFGLNAGTGLVSGSNCVVVGNSAMQAADDDNQVAIGNAAMKNSEGQNNVAIGASALAGSVSVVHTGQFNVCIGTSVMQVAEGAAWNNIGIGGSSLEALTTGTGNTCIGKQAGKLLTTASSNVFIGNSTGDSTTTGSSNILIGSGLDTTSATTTGELRIHYAGGSNIPIISGDMVSGLAGININPADIDATLHVSTESADAVPTLKLQQADTDQPLIEFEATEGAAVANSLSSRTAASIIGYIQIDVNGTKEWIARYSDPTS